MGHDREKKITQNVPDKLHFSIEKVEKNIESSIMNITNTDTTAIKFVSDNDVGQLTILYILSFILLLLLVFSFFLFLFDKKVLKNS